MYSYEQTCFCLLGMLVSGLRKLKLQSSSDRIHRIEGGTWTWPMFKSQALDLFRALPLCAQLSTKVEAVLGECSEDVRVLARLWQLQNKMQSVGGALWIWQLQSKML